MVTNHDKKVLQSHCKNCNRAANEEWKTRRGVKKKMRKTRAAYNNTLYGFLSIHGIQAKQRAKNHNKEWTIDRAYITRLWHRQNGLCAITGLKLGYKQAARRTPYIASLDRINCKKGYIKGNVRWTCWFVNQMRHTYTPAKFKKLITIIYEALK